MTSVHNPDPRDRGRRSERDPGAETAPVPAVSIGLPVYNGERYLREALTSLVGQTFRDFELIISDNASTDATADIVREFQRNDPRIRYFRQETNRGASSNFLFVLGQARAALFMLASHDDVWAENWLEVLTANLRPDDMGIRGAVYIQKGDAIVARKLLPDYRRGAFVRCFLHNENNYRSHYVYSLFYRDKLMAVNIGDLLVDYYSDALFVYYLLYHGGLRSIPETHMRYRFHENNLGNQFSRPWRGWRKLLYRVHPLRYYRYYLRLTRDPKIRLAIGLLIPVKHLYAQVSFWVRGIKTLVLQRELF